MVAIRNLTNSPFDLQSAEGSFVRLPAFGTAEGEFTGDYLDLLRASMAVAIVEDAAPDPIDVMTDEELRALIAESTGRAPHPSAKRATLLAKAREIHG